MAGAFSLLIDPLQPVMAKRRMGANVRVV